MTIKLFLEAFNDECCIFCQYLKTLMGICMKYLTIDVISIIRLQ